MTDETRFLIYTPNSLGAATLGSDFLILVDCPDLGVRPDVQLAFRMGISEAREFALSILRKADEASGASPQS